MVAKGTRREVSPASKIRAGGLLIEHKDYLVDGLVATDGVQYSAVLTVGTIATALFTKLIDIGTDLKLHQIEAGLTARFINRVAAAGSLAFHWQMRQANVATVRDWLNLQATQPIPIGTGAGNSFEHTVSGLAPVGSHPEAPIEIRLMAAGLVDSSFTGEIKNNSYVRYVGSIIPGV